MAQIIPKNLIQVEPNWQKELASGFTDPMQLLTYLQINSAEFEQDALARRLFPMRVPKAFVDKMTLGDSKDPLLQQVLPLRQEFKTHAEFSLDPLAEHNTASKGVLHKYQSRVLLMVRTGCAVNCRYCFRRHFPYQDNTLSKREWRDVINAISQQPEVNEVIFSGGDPLMAKDDLLSWLAKQISAIPHIRRLRIHTRLPVVLPNRVNHAFLQWFGELDVQKIMVLHINHANEIDHSLINKCEQMKQQGITLFNQAVLLAGINDSADAQVNLNEACFAAGIQPYYLHVLDKVQGAAHFLVEDEKAREIMQQVIARQAGFLVPKLVREMAGHPAKTPLDLHLHP